MKSMVITLVIGMAVFAAFLAAAIAILSTGNGIFFLGIISFFAGSYIIGWLIRDIWHMKHG
jgi:hypothetical protein